MTQTSFKTEFTITKDNSILSLNITSGEHCFWPVKQTLFFPVMGTTHKFVIGSESGDLVQLDFTKSTDPGVTGGSTLEDYTNTIHDLVLYMDETTVNGIVGTTSSGGGGGTVDGILGVTGGPVIVNGIVGVTGAAGNPILLDAIIGTTESVTMNRVGNNHTIDVARGIVGGQNIEYVYGRNSAQSTSFEDCWYNGGDYPFLSSASTLEVVSNDNDDDDTGNGARTVHIEGLDANFIEITEVVSLNGNGTSSATSQSFIRVNHFHVETSGTYHGTNFDDIVLRVSGGGSILAVIGKIDGGASAGNSGYGAGEANNGIFTTPVNKIAVVSSFSYSGDDGKETDCQMMMCQNADVTSAPYGRGEDLVWSYKWLKYPMIFNYGQTGMRIPEKTDIWFRLRSKAGGVSSNVQCTLHLSSCIDD